tara:strand:+ start:953 stop:1336 length:384 start_codon:yes stop_codon:yes gene_type:complete
MSMDDFIKTLNEEQKAALLSALSGEQKAEEVTETAEETNDITDDFRVVKKSSLSSNRRREPVKAKGNTWTDTGEHRDVQTPNVQRTPRNRVAPKKKNVTCNACGKTFKVNASIVYGEYYRCDRCVGK